MINYIQIIPDLERKIQKNEYFKEDLDEGNINWGNISYSDVVNRIAEYDEEKDLFYFLIPKGESVRDFQHRHKMDGLPNVKFFFNMDYYNVSSRIVELNPGDENPKILDELHPDLQKRFRILKSLKQADLIEILEELSDITKSVFEYDFGTAKETVGNYFKEWEEKYIPSPLATQKGVCEDQGDIFRLLLNNLGLDQIRYIKKSVSKCIDSKHTYLYHDVSVIFDMNIQSWLVVNSLSPARLYNVVPVEQIKTLGEPFVYDKIKGCTRNLSELIKKDKK